MEIKNNKNSKNNSKTKIQYLKTETIPKPKNLLSISPKYVDNLHRLSYKLYKLNEKCRKTTKNNTNYCNIKDLFSNILVKNYKRKHYIKTLNELNMNTESINSTNNYTNTINNFYTQTTSSGRSSIKRFHKNIPRSNCKSFKRYYFLPKMKLNSFKKMNNFFSPENQKKEKINLCLVPLFKTIRNSRGKSKRREKIEKNKSSNGKEVHNTNDDIFFRKNNSSFPKKERKKELKKAKKFLTIKINKFIESKIEENDMKPKIRFINLKKNLLEETLKINKMFAFFNKQINEQKKTMKFLGKQRNSNKEIKEINKNNIFLNNL